MTDTRRRLITLSTFTTIAVLWSWPAATLPDAVLTRQFDSWGVLWVAGNASRIFGQLHDGMQMWPYGLSLLRNDSLLFILVAAAATKLVAPTTLFHLMMVFGPLANALAAERCARRAFGVRFPWSLIAGSTYGFCGLAATALTEGHVYLVVDPWLPLLLTDLVRGLGPDGERSTLLRAVLWGTLALVTSAYAGIAAAMLVVTFTLRAGWIRADLAALVRVAWAPILLGLGVGLVYSVAFFGVAESTLTPEGWAPAGVLNPKTALSWVPSVDLAKNHSIAAPLGALTLAGLVLAPTVLRDRSGWRAMAGLAVASMLLALGNELRFVERGSGALVAPLGLVGELPVLNFLHFPIRFMWVYALVGGVVAAMVVDTLAARLGWRLVAPVALFALGDAFLLTGMPGRQAAQIATAPSAYAAAPEGRAVLDLTGRSRATDPDIGLRASDDDELMVFRTLGCAYQNSHRRPILESCFMPIDSPRTAVSEVLTTAALRHAAGEPSPSPEALRGCLQALGVGAVAIHVDLLAEEHRAPVRATLTAIAGPPAATSTDGGETVELHVIPEGVGADRALCLGAS